MCYVCDDWGSRSGQGADGIVPHHPSPYVFAPAQWENRAGRTLTWSNATRTFSSDQRQSDLQCQLSDEQVGLVRQAFSTWAAVANINFREAYDSAYSGACDHRIRSKVITDSGAK